MKTIKLLLISMIFIGCADEKTFYLNDPIKTAMSGDTIRAIHAEPYGWANYEARKDKNVVYEVCLGNVIWSVIGIETIFIPVWLSGWQLYEPVELKDCAPNCN